MAKRGWPKEGYRHGLSAKRIRSATGREVSRYHSLGKRREIDWDKDYLTEQEINLIKLRGNRGEEIPHNLIAEKEYEVTPEQARKGFNWLWNLYKTPSGRERKNNPYGWRELYVLENFEG